MSDDTASAKHSIYLQKILENIEKSCEIESHYDENKEKYILTIQENSKPFSNISLKGPRERRRLAKIKKNKKCKTNSIKMDLTEIDKIKKIASFVPDEIIYDHENYAPKYYEAALMFADVSGFTELCEAYTRTGKDGTSRLTQVLNSYIGSMVHEILIHDGDLLKFSGDAFLAMWKSTPTRSLQEAVHAAIDCALIIQRDFGTYPTDIDIVLRVKVAISGGTVLFSLIGDNKHSHYLVVGQPVWDVKAAEYMSKAGDVIASPSAWKYVNPVQYIFKQMKDDPHILIMGTGAMWKNVEKIDVHIDSNTENESMLRMTENNSSEESENDYSDFEEDSLNMTDHINNLLESHTDKKLNNIRLCVHVAIRRNLKEPLQKFILTPVMNAIYREEHLEYLTEMRQVVIVFLNVILGKVSDEVMADVSHKAYKEVCVIVNEKRGLVNKISLFDKDMMFLIVFGLREMKHEKETQNALHCAFQLRKKLIYLKSVQNVSVGVTSGPAYCGVVGHVLRREYTMIGLCVNKAARLMVNYPDKVTCDNKTCLKSKLNRKCFTLMPFKPLKGLKDVGAIYEFNADDLSLGTTIFNYPMVNRFYEINTYIGWVQRFLKTDDSTENQHKAAIITGETMVGKSRLLNAMQEFTPETATFMKINIVQKKLYTQYFLIKEIIKKAFNNYICEKGVTIGSDQFYDVFGEDLNTTQLCFLEEVFNLNTDSHPEISQEAKYKDVLDISIKIFKHILTKLTIVAIDGSENIDEKSWELVPMLISKCQIAILAVVEKIGENMNTLVENPNTIIIDVNPLSLWHHSALVCSMLNVHAITPKLENIIQMYSDGNPGWIENFLIMLIQDGNVFLREITRDEALSLGVVIPHKYDFKWINEESKDNLSSGSNNQQVQHGWRLFESTFKEIDDVKMYLSKPTLDFMKVAFLKNPDEFRSFISEVNKDVLFLKTYDSLLPFEQLVLKCCSALGEIFSRSLLLYVISPNSDLDVARAFEKLFDIGFLKCARGDFTKNLGNILIMRSSIHDVEERTCKCTGINENEKKSSGLSSYAWCGYTRFKDTTIFTSAYDLLTDNQKKNFHTKAITYLEKYTKQCERCKSENFNKVFGYKKEDEFRDEEIELYVASLKESNFEKDLKTPISKRMTKKLVTSGLERRTYNFKQLWSKDKKIYDDNVSVKSFSDFDNVSCTCFKILSAVYTQIIEHCKKSDEIHKLCEGYVEYILFSINFKNIPLAISLILEAESFIKSPKFVLPKNHTRFEKWRTNFLIGRIYSLRGLAMLEIKDYLEAEKYLGQAMELFRCQFPLHNKGTFKNIQKKLEFKIFTKLKCNEYTDVEKIYFNQVSETLSYIYRISKAGGKNLLAYRAAEWSLKYALEAYDNFPILCTAYGNFLTASTLLKKSSARKMIPSALRICIMKENIDRIELEYVIYLYTSILHFRMWNSETKAAFEIGRILFDLLSGNPDDMRLLSLRISSQLSIVTKNFSKSVPILEQLKKMKDINGNNAIEYNAWYLITVLDIHLDTGYTMEHFEDCIKFYMEEENALKIKNIEVYWILTIFIWLRDVRLNLRELFIWNVDNLINEALGFLKNHVFVILRLIEGILLYLVNAMNNKDIEECTRVKIIIKKILKKLKQSCKNNKNLLARYYLMKAYFRFIVHNDKKVIQHLEHGLIFAIEAEDLIMQNIFTHNEKAWHNRLTTDDRDIWKNHSLSGKELSLVEMKKYRENIFVFTLPTPEYRFQ